MGLKPLRNTKNSNSQLSKNRDLESALNFIPLEGSPSKISGERGDALIHPCEWESS